MKALISPLAIALLAVGCAAGKPETRIVDAAGADLTRYGKDLGECKRFASSYELKNAASNAKFSLNGFEFGNYKGMTLDSELNKGISASSMARKATANESAAAKAAPDPALSQRVESIAVDCMSERGYRIVDGGSGVPAVHPSSYVPSGARATRTSAVAPAAALPKR